MPTLPRSGTVVQEPQRPWQTASVGGEEWRSVGFDEGETDGADRGIQEACRASSVTADSAGGSGAGAKAGRGKGVALPDLHQVAASRDSGRARKAKNGINLRIRVVCSPGIDDPVYACGRGSERCAYGVIQIVGASRRWEESSLKGRLKPE